jgi:hypothetical protein
MCFDRNRSIFRVFSPNYNIIHSQVANCEWKHNCSCTHTYINLKVNTVCSFKWKKFYFKIFK